MVVPVTIISQVVQRQKRLLVVTVTILSPVAVVQTPLLVELVTTQLLWVVRWNRSTLAQVMIQWSQPGTSHSVHQLLVVTALTL